MAQTTIAKNNTGSAVSVEDLGIEIPGSGQRILSDTFSESEICESQDLKTLVGDSTFTINDGSNDLSVADGLEHIRCKGEGGGVYYDATTFVPHTLSDHLDVSGTSPDDKYGLTYNAQTGLWEPQTRDVNTGDVAPDSTAVVWIPPEDRMPFFYDPLRGEWLSISRHYYTFNRSGNVDGSYLAVGGWYSVDFFYIPNPVKITAVFCRIYSGNNNKTFSLRNNSTEIFNFNMGGSRTYADNDADFDIEGGTVLRCYVSGSGSSVRNPSVQLIASWRYTG